MCEKNVFRFFRASASGKQHLCNNRFIFQGLSDTEEFVVSKALNALTCLAELGLLQKPALRELVSEIVPFLCHPVSFIMK